MCPPSSQSPALEYWEVQPWANFRKDPCTLLFQDREHRIGPCSLTKGASFRDSSQEGENLLQDDLLSHHREVDKFKQQLLWLLKIIISAEPRTTPRQGRVDEV